MFKSTAIAIVLTLSSIVSANSLQNPEAIEKEIMSLDWKTAGTYSLSSSHSSLSIPSDHIAVIGKDARKLSDLSGNGSDSSLEAITINEDGDNVVYFSNHNIGYVSLNDWEKVDPTELLQNITENTEEDNKTRKRKGIPEIRVIGWIQEPTLDKYTNTVYWSIEMKEDGEDENGFNSAALRLGRHGYERVVWIGDISNYKAFGGELDAMLRAHSFDPGHRYSDFSAGDKIASYGIATLVAATVGAKVAKAGGLAILFKKMGGLLAAGVAAVSYKLRNIFGRKKTGR